MGSATLKFRGNCDHSYQGRNIEPADINWFLHALQSHTISVGMPFCTAFCAPLIDGGPSLRDMALLLFIYFCSWAWRATRARLDAAWYIARSPRRCRRCARQSRGRSGQSTQIEPGQYTRDLLINTTFYPVLLLHDSCAAARP